MYKASSLNSYFIDGKEYEDIYTKPAILGQILRNSYKFTERVKTFSEEKQKVFEDFFSYHFPFPYAFEGLIPSFSKLFLLAGDLDQDVFEAFHESAFEYNKQKEFLANEVIPELLRQLYYELELKRKELISHYILFIEDRHQVNVLGSNPGNYFNFTRKEFDLNTEKIVGMPNHEYQNLPDSPLNTNFECTSGKYDHWQLGGAWSLFKRW